MLRAIIMQNLNLAAKGDSAAFGNLLKLLKAHRPDGGDNLFALAQEFRAIHAQHEASDQERHKVLGTDEAKRETEEQQGIDHMRKDE